MDVLEIKGKVNTAICYARVVEDEAIEQIRRMCDYAMIIILSSYDRIRFFVYRKKFRGYNKHDTQLSC